MATKAQQERSRQERSKPKRAPAPKRPRRDVPVDTSQPGVSATDRRAGIGNTAARNFDKRAAKKAVAMLENSATKPSRKSTRRSAATHLKAATPLTAETKRRNRSPESTAASAKAKATTVRGKPRGGA